MDLLGDDIQFCIIRIDRAHRRPRRSVPDTRLRGSNSGAPTRAIVCARYEEAVMADRSAESSM